MNAKSVSKPRAKAKAPTPPKASAPRKKVKTGRLDPFSATLLKDNVDYFYEIPQELKPLAIRYPWMFPVPHLDMLMPGSWRSAFTELCFEISAILGNNRHGFHWRKLVVVNGEPMWYWRFDDDLEMRMDSFLRGTKVPYSYQQPASDPNSELFQWIQELVHNARQEAMADERRESGKTRRTA